ncbi:AraC family transcriptional regulator [Paenibacillus tyrfis]|uniref:AraC family transcriptional regulator n=1 Tax=Paenibacillus tyrfis TaxID=1501230 RepID=UPI000B58F533|nr:AraC family transcriptional regulator [Paenibacillus tyrfis]
MNELNFIFFIKHPEQTYIQAHQHGCCELVYYFQGDGITQIGSRQHTFREGTFALISPHVLHDENHKSEESEVICIGFHSGYPGMKDLNSVFEDDEDRTIGQFLLRMKREFTEQREGYSEMLDLMVAELIIHLQRLLRIHVMPPTQEDQMQYVINFMDEHFQQNISVETLATMSGYSYDRFRHLFKEKTGAAPLRYLFLKRLELAKSLLLNTKMLVSEIASETGFINDAQFCSIFKRETGLTPKTFRNKFV